ncbi:MAG TPA: hypothetical protein VGB37_03450 [Candidatus Lokiarchaeia archaeon]
MKDVLKEIEELIEKESINAEKIRELQISFIQKELKKRHCVDKFIGDFPTFIEPVHLGDNVKIGDDVLIGPNVYIGKNCEIGDFTELINTIIFDNVVLGENFKLENCIVAKDFKSTASNFSAFGCILRTNKNGDQKIDKFFD